MSWLRKLLRFFGFGKSPEDAKPKMEGPSRKEPPRRDPPPNRNAERIVYQGPAIATTGGVTFYSRDTWQVMIIIGDGLRGYPILTAEIPAALCMQVGLGGMLFVPVVVTVVQRGNNHPRVADIQFTQPRPNPFSQQERFSRRPPPPPPQAKPDKDYYTVLGVRSGATPEEIQKAYRKLMKQCHPDLFPGNKQKEAQAKEVNEAHSVLSDPHKRAAYDLTRRF